MIPSLVEIVEAAIRNQPCVLRDVQMRSGDVSFSRPSADSDLYVLPGSVMCCVVSSSAAAVFHPDPRPWYLFYALLCSLLMWGSLTETWLVSFQREAILKEFNKSERFGRFLEHIQGCRGY